MSLPEGKVLYQAYPISFGDGNGDGIGDFRGIVQRLPYLQDQLGVDGLWLSPFFESPWRDGGYDVSDYRRVNEFLHGPQAEAEHMIQAARARGFDIIADFVPSHASDRHQFFQEALQDPTDTRFIFREAAPQGTPPNNWLSIFPRREYNESGELIGVHAESAWRHVREKWPHAHPDRLDQYFLTSFAEHQPNWNHANPEVRKYLRESAKEWLAKGIQGFRVDAVDFSDHNREYPDEPRNMQFKPGNKPYDFLQRKHSARGENLMGYLSELISVIEEFPDSYMMLESYPDRGRDGADPIQHYMNYYRGLRKFAGRVAPFCFELTDLDWKAQDFKHAIDSFMAALGPHDIPIFPGGNHDKQRIASRYNERAARAAGSMMLALPGTIVIYQGDELGMTNHIGIPIDRLTDPFLGRDVSRSPLPMHARDARAGYSERDPRAFRLPIHPEYHRFNVETQQQDPDSTWQVYHQSITLRKRSKTLQFGAYESIETNTNQLYAYARLAEQGDGNYISITNFSREAVRMSIGHLAARSDIVASSTHPSEKHHSADGDSLIIAGDESIVLRPRA